MQPEPRDTHDTDGDSSDVVTGPVGSARLVEPTTAEALSADLDRLPGVADVDKASSSHPSTEHQNDRARTPFAARR